MSLPTAAVRGLRVPARKGARDVKFESPAVKSSAWLAKEQQRGLPTLRHFPDEKQAPILSSLLASFSFALKSYYVPFNGPASERLLMAREAIYN